MLGEISWWLILGQRSFKALSDISENKLFIFYCFTVEKCNLVNTFESKIAPENCRSLYFINNWQSRLIKSTSGFN